MANTDIGAGIKKILANAMRIINEALDAGQKGLAAKALLNDEQEAKVRQAFDDFESALREAYRL